MFTDVSIDLETLAITADAAIVQIGLAAFNQPPNVFAPVDMPTMRIGVDPQSCIDLGMRVQWSTVAWWLEQEQRARESLLRNAYGAKSIVHALDLVTAWFQQHTEPNNIGVWGNGATFDVSIMEKAYQLVGRKPPWSYRSARDLRTLRDLADPARVIELPKPHIEHDALYDAVAQAEAVILLRERINNGLARLAPDANP